MKSEKDGLKNRIINQIADDFYTRFESTEEKLERLRQLQMGEFSLPEGLEEQDGEFHLPDVAEMHAMLLRSVKKRLSPMKVAQPAQGARDEAVEEMTEVKE